MARKVKCPICGTSNDKEVAIFYSQHYYCKICYENKQKEAEDYKVLYNYICELYNVDILNGWILKQIKDYKEQFKYTYNGMRASLDYFYHVKKENEPEEGMGIGIIPFIYDETRKFYADKKLINNSAENCDVEKIQTNIKTIHIKEQDKITNEKYKNITMIDISQL